MAACTPIGYTIGSAKITSCMDFALTPEHIQIREAAYRFGQAEIVPGLRERDRAAESDPSILKRMGEAGFLGVSVPESYGGMGADYISLGIVCEDLNLREPPGSLQTH